MESWTEKYWHQKYLVKFSAWQGGHAILGLWAIPPACQLCVSLHLLGIGTRLDVLTKIKTTPAGPGIR